MISYMVYRCMQTPVNLVSSNYYKDELAYQEVIDGTRAANRLSTRPVLTETSGDMFLTMPAEMRGRSLDGVVVFYCPSDMTRDRRVPLRPDADGRQRIEGRLVPPGNYTVKVSWRVGATLYYAEQPLQIR